MLEQPIYQMPITPSLTSLTAGTKWGKIKQLFNPANKLKGTLYLPDSTEGHELAGRLLVEGCQHEIKHLTANKVHSAFTVSIDALESSGSYGSETPIAEIYFALVPRWELDIEVLRYEVDYTLRLLLKWKPTPSQPQPSGL